MAKILVIDDEMGIRELLSEILEDEGHEIILAENAASARIAYAQPGIDLALLDIWMPDTDGMTLLREWTTLQTLQCPVIMMSGHASVDTALEAQNLGASGFLEKPIAMHTLLATVHKALHRAALLQSQAQAQSQTQTQTQTQTALDAAAPSKAAHSALPTDAQPQLHDIAPTAPVRHSSADAANGVAALHAPAAIPSAAAPNPWQQAMAGLSLDTDLRQLRESVERIYFNYLLDSEPFGMTSVAERAGLERTHLYRKLKQLNIELGKRSKRSTSEGPQAAEDVSGLSENS